MSVHPPYKPDLDTLAMNSVPDQAAFNCSFREYIGNSMPCQLHLRGYNQLNVIRLYLARSVHQNEVLWLKLTLKAC